ncbi:MAG: MotA/TolQ/ExbB proton channel family protein, partial [Ramlibacter sp.]|nr:MotA/TolQ/ExbB proton channel family protein [Ramlibacter sp.]
MNLWQLFERGDLLTQLVAMLLLAMSVASWVVILWKAWLLQRAGGDVARCVAAFWRAGSLEDAQRQV